MQTGIFWGSEDSHNQSKITVIGLQTCWQEKFRSGYCMLGLEERVKNRQFVDDLRRNVTSKDMVSPKQSFTIVENMTSKHMSHCESRASGGPLKQFNAP
jgi:hypothetical protein